MWVNGRVIVELVRIKRILVEEVSFERIGGILLGGNMEGSGRIRYLIMDNKNLESISWMIGRRIIVMVGGLMV